MATHLNLLWVQLTTTVGSLLLLFDPRSTTETHKPRSIGKGRSVERSGVDEEMLCKWFVVISIPILQIAPPCHSSAPHHWIRIVKWSSIIPVRRQQPHRLQREKEWTDDDCHTQAESFVQQGIQIFIELSCQDELCKTNWSGTDLSEGSEYLHGNISVHPPLHHTLGLTEHKGHPRAGRLFFASIGRWWSSWGWFAVQSIHECLIVRVDITGKQPAKSFCLGFIILPNLLELFSSPVTISDRFPSELVQMERELEPPQELINWVK